MDRKDRSYTLLLIPGHNNGKTISVHCSHFALVAGVITGALVLVMAGFATVTSFDSVRKARALAELRSANEMLVKENARVSDLSLKIGKLDTLAAYLQGLAEINPSSPKPRAADIVFPGSNGVDADNAAGIEDSMPSTAPVRGWVTQKFSIDTVRRGGAHPGIDIAADEGTPIVAAAPGRVSDVTLDRFYGNLVTIDHGNGYVTRYGHCLKIFVVKGQRVTRGQRIAQVGSTGYSSAPHLHYEVIKNGKNINPLGFIVAGKNNP